MKNNKLKVGLGLGILAVILVVAFYWSSSESLQGAMRFRGQDGGQQTQQAAQANNSDFDIYPQSISKMGGGAISTEICWEGADNANMSKAYVSFRIGDFQSGTYVNMNSDSGCNSVTESRTNQFGLCSPEEFTVRITANPEWKGGETNRANNVMTESFTWSSLPAC